MEGKGEIDMERWASARDADYDIPSDKDLPFLDHRRPVSSQQIAVGLAPLKALKPLRISSRFNVANIAAGVVLFRTVIVSS